MNTANEVMMIHINDTVNPRTGGQYVYYVIKDELLKNGFKIIELSTPLLVKKFTGDGVGKLNVAKRLLAEIPVRAQCYLTSVIKYKTDRKLIITSSSPDFPVFGHITYHQPLAGLNTNFAKTPYVRLPQIFYDWLNLVSRSLWPLAERTILIHLSNSEFTKKYLEQKYGVKSTVIYPPVPLTKYRHTITGSREPLVVVAKPLYCAGITILPDIVKHIIRKAKVVIIGHPDRIGLQIIKLLKKYGVVHLGYVSESEKIRLLSKASIFLSLAHNEPFGILIVEAMAAGCIPIVHDSGGPQEYLPPELRYKNPQEAAEKILNHLYAGNQLRRELKELSRKFDENIFRKKIISVIKYLHRIMKA